MSILMSDMTSDMMEMLVNIERQLPPGLGVRHIKYGWGVIVSTPQDRAEHVVRVWFRDHGEATFTGQFKFVECDEWVMCPTRPSDGEVYIGCGVNDCQWGALVKFICWQDDPDDPSDFGRRYRCYAHAMAAIAETEFKTRR